MVIPKTFMRRAKLATMSARLKALESEKRIELEFCTAKDDAMREFVNSRIAHINAATRATNGPKFGVKRLE